MSRKMYSFKNIFLCNCVYVLNENYCYVVIMLPS